MLICRGRCCHHLQYDFNGIIAHHPCICLTRLWGYQLWVVPLSSHHLLRLQLSTQIWAGKGHCFPTRNGRPWAWLSRQLALTQVPSHLGFWWRELEQLSQGRTEQRKHLPINPKAGVLPSDEAEVWQSAVYITPPLQCLWLTVAKKYLKKTLISSVCKAVPHLFPPPMHTWVQITQVHFYPHALVYRAWLSPQGAGSRSRSQSHHPVRMRWAGMVHRLREHKFPLRTLDSFLWKGSIPSAPKGQKQMARQRQVPAHSSARVPAEIPFFAIHRAGWREWDPSPGTAVPNHKHI